MLKHFKMFGNKKNKLQNPSLQKKFEQKCLLSIRGYAFPWYGKDVDSNATKGS